ncbi:type IX secretion system protein PorD [Flavobacterium sp.]|uniref:type IX secretion system protein PorD n=2 Tax=Flavobacterium sp. TaxID=239 RepID=UPI0040478555
MMRKVLVVAVFLFAIVNVFSQELNATVSVNYQQVANGNPQLFKNLETQVKEFLNTTKWTTKEYTDVEKIDCNFFINVNTYGSNNFEATLQVQSSRPVYNSSLSSPIVNINDKNFTFRFIEFENLIYDQNSFNSNLVSVLAFYSNLIIGLDQDSFSELGGTEYLQIASNIVNVAQTSGYKGWSQSEGNNNNRNFLISDMLSNTFTPFRRALYEYHRLGLDLMEQDIKKGKEGVIKGINALAEVQKVRPNALLTRTFFDAKTDEIVSIFSGGPNVDVAPLLVTLNRISPLNSQKWSQIK